MIAFPLPWKVVIGAALLTMVLGAMWWSFGEGKDAARSDTLKKIFETQRSIIDADARGPRTSDDVERRLRDGSF